MKRTLLKSKIHHATVTDANLLYQGSISIDPLLMEAADFVPHERVEIYNCTNGERFATYAIPGTPGKGEIVINGAAAHKVRVGDRVIVTAFALTDEAVVPKMILVDAHNHYVSDLPAVGE